MTTLRSYQNLGEAGFAQSLLEAAGIPAVLDHEAGTALSPVGVSAVRLQVPQEHVLEAQRILADHPVQFSYSADDAPRFGFWRGSVYGLLAGAVIIFVPRLFGFTVPLPLLVMLFAWWFGAIFGMNHKVRQTPLDDSKA